MFHHCGYEREPLRYGRYADARPQMIDATT
jgi:hypothetical protein